MNKKGKNKKYSKIPEELVKLFRKNWNGEITFTRRQVKKYVARLRESNYPEGLVIVASYNLFKDEAEFNAEYIRLMSKAIDQNFVPAMLLLAEHYYQQNQMDKAIVLYEKAASMNYTHALRELSIAYQYGYYGYPKNPAKSHSYMEKSKTGIKWDFFDGFDTNEEQVTHMILFI